MLSYMCAHIAAFNFSSRYVMQLLIYFDVTFSFYSPIHIVSVKFAQNWQFLPMCPCLSWWNELKTNWRWFFCSTSSANLALRRLRRGVSCLLLKLTESNLHSSLKAVEAFTPKLLKKQAKETSSILSPFTQNSDLHTSRID